MKYIKVIIIAYFLIIISSCDKKNKEIKQSEIAPKEFEILNVYQHSINSFTEGLFIDNGIVFESTGSPIEMANTISTFGILDLKTGALNSKVILDKSLFFGEGITKCKDKIYQLTYKNKIGFVYDAATFKKINSFIFDADEGWGLTTYDNETIIMSDGTNCLTFIDVNNFKSKKKLTVFDNELPVTNLNELEFVNGYIYANVYTTNKIVKINPLDGKVVKTYDFSKLYYEVKNLNINSLEMNGIAYNSTTQTFFLTGKMWPLIYEVKITD